jgi:hypothetical protein
VEPPAVLKEAIQKMDAVALEIRFQPATAKEIISRFREMYGI